MFKNATHLKVGLAAQNPQKFQKGLNNILTEHEKLSNRNNYKIYIQQKFNRKQKSQTKYLTRDLTFSKDISDAFEFENFQEAENFLNNAKHLRLENIKPRIIIMYFENIFGEKCYEQNQNKK